MSVNEAFNRSREVAVAAPRLSIVADSSKKVGKKKKDVTKYRFEPGFGKVPVGCPKFVPFTTAMPSMCSNGYANQASLNPPSEPSDNYVVPLYNRTSSPRYKVPHSPCGNVGGVLSVTYETNSGCTYCSDQWQSFQNLMSKRGAPGTAAMVPTALNDVLIAEETLLKRRLTWTEFNCIRNYIQLRGVITITGSFLLMAKDYHELEARDSYLSRIASYQSQDVKAREHLRSLKAKDKAHCKANMIRFQKALEVASVIEPSEPTTVNLTEQKPGASQGPNSRWSYCGCYVRSECRCWEDRPHHRSGGVRKSTNHGVPFLMPSKAPGNKRMVGIEVEFNQTVDLSRWVTKWNGAVHTDGSCGEEAVTTPLAGSHIDACVKELCKDLRDLGAGCDERCAVHVHVDAHDITWQCMFRLIRVYALVEPILYLLGGQNRLDSRYAAPCGQYFLTAILDKLDPKKALLCAAITDGTPFAPIDARSSMKERVVQKKSHGRYKGLNILPWIAGRRVNAPDTTIEFRLHRNSIEGARIAGWAHLLADIVSYASKASEADVSALPKSALRALCKHIAPDSEKWIMKRVAEWRRATTAEKTTSKSTALGDRAAKRRLHLINGIWSYNLKGSY